MKTAIQKNVRTLKAKAEAEAKAQKKADREARDKALLLQATRTPRRCTPVRAGEEAESGSTVIHGYGAHAKCAAQPRRCSRCLAVVLSRTSQGFDARLFAVMPADGDGAIAGTFR